MLISVEKMRNDLIEYIPSKILAKEREKYEYLLK